MYGVHFPSTTLLTLLLIQLKQYKQYNTGSIRSPYRNQYNLQHFFFKRHTDFFTHSNLAVKTHVRLIEFD